jgi:hypothetical protein
VDVILMPAPPLAMQSPDDDWERVFLADYPIRSANWPL